MQTVAGLTMWLALVLAIVVIKCSPPWPTPISPKIVIPAWWLLFAVGCGWPCGVFCSWTENEQLLGLALHLESVLHGGVAIWPVKLAKPVWVI